MWEKDRRREYRAGYYVRPMGVLVDFSNKHLTDGPLLDVNIIGFLAYHANCTNCGELFGAN